jgi:CRISPR-associated protein Cas1
MRWTSFRALAGAWEQVRQDNPAPGIDGQRARDFARASAVEVTMLGDELRAGTYRPLPLKGFRIPDATKGSRLVGAPALRDRIAQRALLDACAPKLTEWLHPNCHGYVRGRSTLTAQTQAARWAGEGLRWCLHVDVADAFGTVDRARLEAVWVERTDAATAAFVAAWTGVPLDEAGEIHLAGEVGIPLGQPVSPLSLNLWLAPLDQRLAAKGWHFIRYADDLLVMAAERPALDDALTCVTEALAELGMSLRESKTKIMEIPGDPVPFLGRMLASDTVLEPVSPRATKPQVEDPGALLESARTRTLYVQTAGSLIRAENGRAIVSLRGEEVVAVRLGDIDRVMLLAPATLTSPFLAACLSRGIPVHISAWRHAAFGTLTRTDAQDPLLLRAQIESVSDGEFRLQTAKAVLAAKLSSIRWLMKIKRGPMAMRYRVAAIAAAVDAAPDVPTLLGLEGEAAVCWWQVFGILFEDKAIAPHTRTRRPPRDPVNSLLSFGYTLLLDEVQSLLIEMGLSPYFAYLHALRSNHPALASDLMEEFRAPVVDRFVMQAFNLRQFAANDFVIQSDGAVFLEDGARRRFLELWEQHMAEPCWGSQGGRLLSPRDGLWLQVRRFRDYVLGRRGAYAALFDPKGGPCAA